MVANPIAEHRFIVGFLEQVSPQLVGRSIG
jgi:hypothetical protein